MSAEARHDAPVLGLPPAQFAAAFPFHFAVDADLTVLQVGATLRRLCPDVAPGAALPTVLRPLRPEGSLTLDWIRANRSRFFLLQHAGNGIQLRGEFVELPADGALLFLGSPWFSDAAEIAARGLRYDDFAIHDPVVDMLQAFQASKLALADAKKLAAKLTAQREELRAANERLQAQESEASRLALIAARTDNAVVLTDAKGLVVWVNEGFTRLTGYAPEEVLGRTPGSVLQGQDTDAATVAFMRDRIARGQAFNGEILNYRRDGRAYWTAIEAQPICDAEGRVVNFMAIESDVTARRAAQQRQSIQFEVAHVLAEATPLQPALARIVRIVCERLGWLLGQVWQVAADRLQLVDTWHPPSGPVAEFVAASRRNTDPVEAGFLGRVVTGRSPCWLPDVARDPGFLRGEAASHAGLHGAFAFPILVRGETWGVLEFFSRRTEERDDALLQTLETIGVQIGSFVARREAEDALRSSEERFRLALEGAALGTWDLHVPSGVVSMNERYLEMIGYAREELEATYAALSRLVHQDDLPRVVEAYRAHLDGKAVVYEAEYRLRHKSGAWVWVLDSGKVIERDAEGRPLRVCGTHLDITARKAAERELRAERELLEEARRRELATGVAIQRALLFGDRPADVPAAEIGSYTEPSLGIDGDFYAFTRYRGDCLELLVGDVMGKGVPAALVGAAVRTAYNQVGTELLAESLGSGELPRPAAVMNALHRKLTPRLIELDTFVTMALYRFDFGAGTMTLVNAGHTAGLVLRHGGGVDTVLGDNLPMGVLAEEHYVESTVDVAAGDALVVYSDGVTEARNTEGVEFGVERLQDFLERASRCAPPVGICMQALRKAVRDFIGLRAIPDDQTAVIVALHAPGREATSEFDLPWDLAGLAPLRRHVAAAAAALGEDASDRLVLAAFEAATNVVRHVARPFDDATLCCRIERGADRVTVELWYLGLPFVRDPDAEPDFSGASEGGFGLYIIEQAVSEARYETPLLDVCCTRLVQTAPALA